MLDIVLKNHLWHQPGREEPVENSGEDGELSSPAGHPHMLNHRPHAYHRIHCTVVSSHYITRPVPQRTNFDYFRRNLYNFPQ